MWAARASACSAVMAAAIATVIAVRIDEPAAPVIASPAADLPSDPIRVTTREPAIASCPTPDDSEVSGDEAILAGYWRVKNACEPLPRCLDPHPVVKLVADVDPATGVERMIGSKRFGVAMVSAGGELLGFYEAACSNRGDDEYLKLSARNFIGGPRPQLVIRERTDAHCGEFDDLTVVRRVGDELEPILEIDEGGHRGCNVWQGEWHARIAVRPGAVTVISSGWYQRGTEATGWEYGPREPVRTVCQMRLAADGRFDRVDDRRETLEPPGDIRCD